jgi:hypothetical protein
MDIKARTKTNCNKKPFLILIFYNGKRKFFAGSSCRG